MNHQSVSARPGRMEGVVRELFEHQALLLAGWADRAHLSDRARWDLVRLMDATRRRMNRRLNDALPNERHSKRRGTTHPAFRAFLAKVSERNQRDTHMAKGTMR